MILHACCRYLRDHARGIAGKSQLFINAYAKALEIIPRQLCDNAGFDATDVLNNLRQKHALKSGEGQNYGVDVNTGGVLLQEAACQCRPSLHTACPDSSCFDVLPAPAEASYALTTRDILCDILCVPPESCWRVAALATCLPELSCLPK